MQNTWQALQASLHAEQDKATRLTTKVEEAQARTVELEQQLSEQAESLKRVKDTNILIMVLQHLLHHSVQVQYTTDMEAPARSLLGLSLQ